MGLAIAAPRAVWGPLRRAPLLVGVPRVPGGAGWLAAAVPHLVFLAGSGLLLYPALTAGAVQWEDDTKYFYYPFLATIAVALREGRLPLWEPGVFGGYPLFADGEGGMLYPPNLLALRALEPAAALVALRLVRWYLAAAFTYGYLRAVGCTRTAAVTGGVAFMGSGFMVGQVVHENLASGMVWLPLALYFVERALRSAPGARYRYAAFAGVALAMQALAVHVQVCLFTALVVFPYVGWRVLWRSPLRAHVLDRVGIGVAVGLTAGVTGLGLAAVQVLPLLALAERSARGSGIGLSDATINSVTPFRLLTTVFPDLLRLPDGTPFGHWVDWDVAVFVGAPTLLLACVAVALRRDGLVAFFAVVAVAALLLSMGRYGPPWVVAVTRDLLGEHGLRSPGRFAFLWSFGVAVLAGLGVDWLMRSGGGTRRAAGRLWLGVVAGAAAGVSAGLLSAAGAGRAWLAEHPAEGVAWMERTFMAYDRTVRLKVTAADAYAAVLHALAPESASLRGLALAIVGGYAVFVGWCLVGAAERGGRRGREQRWARGALAACTVAVTAGPLVGAAGRAHPAHPVAAAISPDSRASGFLRAQLAPQSGQTEERPLYRTYTSQAVYLGRTDVEPNVLLPYGVQEAGGYSSLNSDRHTAYAWASETSGGRMLDVWNARYYVVPNQAQPLPSYELTAFHPERPILSGSATNAGAAAWFRVPGVEGENVRVVATLRDAWRAVPGAVAGWVVAEDELGERHVWPLRVGLEIAEATAADPAMRGQRPAELAEEHAFPLEVHTGREYAGDGSTFAVRLFYAKLPLSAPRRIVRVGVEAAPMAAAPEAILRVHGLGVGQPDWWVHNVAWHDRERFTPAFSDEEVRVYRNETALPRAYLVPVGVTLAAEAHVKHMAERGFDPERMVLIEPPAAGQAKQAGQVAPVEDFAVGSWYAPREEPLADGAALVTAEDGRGRASRSPAGRVTIEHYSGDAVVLRVAAERAGWLILGDRYDPAWKGRVDGVEAPVLRANAMFRAVAVPAGEHRVEMRFEPEPLRRGALITLATAVALAAGLLARPARRTALAVRRRARRQVERRASVETGERDEAVRG